MNPGQKVFVLRPFSSNQSLSKWRGPLKIIGKVTSAKYEIKMGKSLVILNKNVMKLFRERPVEEEVARVNVALGVDPCQNKAERRTAIGDDDVTDGWKIVDNRTRRQRAQRGRIYANATSGVHMPPD